MEVHPTQVTVDCSDPFALADPEGNVFCVSSQGAD